MYVTLPFSLKDSEGQKVAFAADVQLMEGEGSRKLDGRALLGVDFLDAKGLGFRLRSEEIEFEHLVVGGGRKIPLERGGDIAVEGRSKGLRLNRKIACLSCARPDRGLT
jgi:hypothetical protein